MCGIAGFFSKSYTEASLQKMTNALAHRGPNATNYFLDAEKGVGLGHRRLSIIDLSEAANQPFYSNCGRYVMVFNGEIYNYRELAVKLPFRFKTSSDTEVLLQAYVHFGDDFVNHLNGMFAIAIYDTQANELKLFRDRIGIKPIYFYRKGNDFAFASETKALLQLAIDKEINVEALKDYLFLEYIPASKSIFKHIQKLEAGHALSRKSDGSISLVSYYNLLEKFNKKGEIKVEQAKSEFQEIFSKSVAYRSISDVPIGAFLSGGTDSSLVCATFQKQNAQPINSFNIAFKEADYDESPWAKKVAEQLKTNHHVSVSTAKDSLELIKQLPKHYCEPFASVSTIPTLQVSQHARQEVTVALSGDVGDELFMGYGYYHWYNRLAKVQKLGGGLGRKLTAALLNFGNLRQQRAARVFDAPDLEKMWLHVWSQEQYMFSEKEISSLLGENYRHETLLADWQTIEKLPLSPFEKISLFDLRHYLPNNLLHKVDIASMAHGLEVRVPFLDHNLVEFAINLPQSLKIQEGEQKYLLKKVLESYLPKPLIYRKKWGFPAPFEHWLQDDLKPLIAYYLNEAVLQKQGIFSPAFVAQLLKEFVSGKTHHFKRVWALLYFQLWYEEYVDDLII